tara:strand:- start:568 stop:1692 length:1125 start_codon:yes stop_codon:yes gene_type:complete
MTSRGGFGRFVDYARAIEKATYGSDGEWRVMEKTGLSVLPLRSFISAWSSELTDYYGEDFGSVYEGMKELEDCPGSFVRDYSQPKTIDDSEFGVTIIFVLADLATNIDSTWIPPHVQKKYRRSGKLRRKKFRHQWAYQNPLNRIHGFLIMKDVTNSQHTQKTMCIDTICASYFTMKKGIGSDLMILAKDFSVALGAYDIVLEVANEFSGSGFPEESDEDEDEDESDEDEDGEEDSDEEDSDEEDEDIWYPDDNAMNILTEELWKKCMRKSKDGSRVYYNLDQEYIEAGLWNYFHCAHECEKGELWEGTEKRIISDKDDPKDTEYGGFWYLKGKRSQEQLMKFYSKFGFIEDSKVHTEWCMFSEIPYPTMRCNLK